MATWTKIIPLIALSAILNACATSKEDVIPKSKYNMTEIYGRHYGVGLNGASMSERELAVARAKAQSRAIEHGAKDLHGYTQQASNEINTVFPHLPNPQLVMFVFPHLSRSGTPVPGYSTNVSMYAVDQYAMPGEVYQP